jgi:hypothetical protein
MTSTRNDLLRLIERFGHTVPVERIEGYPEEEQVIWLVAYLESLTRNFPRRPSL